MVREHVRVDHFKTVTIIIWLCSKYAWYGFGKINTIILKSGVKVQTTATCNLFLEVILTGYRVMV